MFLLYNNNKKTSTSFGVNRSVSVIYIKLSGFGSDILFFHAFVMSTSSTLLLLLHTFLTELVTHLHFP